MADKHGGPKKYLPPTGKPKLPPHKIKHGVVLPLEGMQIAEGKTQRDVDWNWVQWLVDNWDESMAGSIVINRRPSGIYYICNGQHRWWAKIKLDHEVGVCEVHYGLAESEEACLFDGVNEQKLIKPVDRYIVRKNGEWPQYLATEKVLIDHKLLIAHSASANQVKAVNAVMKIVSTYGPATLDRVLTVAELAWGRTQETWDNSLLGGLGQFIGKHGHQIDDVRFAKKLQSGGTPGVYKGRTTARGGEGRVNGAYEVFRARYNQGRTTGLI